MYSQLTDIYLTDVALRKLTALNFNKNAGQKSRNLRELSEKRVIFVSNFKHYVELINSDFNAVFICVTFTCL